MRRFLAFTVLCVLAVSTVSLSFADAFSLRNGIVFGDTIDDVVAKEKTLTRESDDSNWFKGTISGYDDAQCGFLL